jgi:hypothetical protein
MNTRTIYLVLAILGAAIPLYFFAQHFGQTGLAFADFLGAAYANPAASGLTSDLLISSGVFWIAMYHRRSRLGGPNPLPFIFINILIGLSCALPAYLFMLARPDRTPQAAS